mmetsp:Transcript_27628/g.47710  ORF Transcript_27628/g.47710 Transcript_27628/m.47710 type:complete len:279 (-) Transcript_27628:785-1621(-)
MFGSESKKIREKKGMSATMKATRRRNVAFSNRLSETGRGDFLQGEREAGGHHLGLRHFGWCERLKTVFVADEAPVPRLIHYTLFVVPGEGEFEVEAGGVSLEPTEGCRLLEAFRNVGTGACGFSEVQGVSGVVLAVARRCRDLGAVCTDLAPGGLDVEKHPHLVVDGAVARNGNYVDPVRLRSGAHSCERLSGRGTHLHRTVALVLQLHQILSRGLLHDIMAQHLLPFNGRFPFFFWQVRILVLGAAVRFVFRTEPGAPKVAEQSPRLLRLNLLAGVV